MSIYNEPPPCMCIVPHKDDMTMVSLFHVTQTINNCVLNVDEICLILKHSRIEYYIIIFISNLFKFLMSSLVLYCIIGLVSVTTGNISLKY